MKLLILCALTICATILATIPNSNPLKVAFDSIFSHDKLMHCIGSQVLFIVAFRLFKCEKAAFRTVVIIGYAIEVGQHFSGRGFDFWDFVACAVGAEMCCVLRRL